MFAYGAKTGRVKNKVFDRTFLKNSWRPEATPLGALSRGRNQLEAGHCFALRFGTKWKFQHTTTPKLIHMLIREKIKVYLQSICLCAVGEQRPGSAWSKIIRWMIFDGRNLFRFVWRVAVHRYTFRVPRTDVRQHRNCFSASIVFYYLYFFKVCRLLRKATKGFALWKPTIF